MIVFTSILEIILSQVTTSVGAISALRVLRALKPLRLLTRSAGMRLVFKSVTMSLMSMANVSIVCILFFLIFAILGVQLFEGRFYRCVCVSVYMCVGGGGREGGVDCVQVLYGWVLNWCLCVRIHKHLLEGRFCTCGVVFLGGGRSGDVHMCKPMCGRGWGCMGGGGGICMGGVAWVGVGGVAWVGGGLHGWGALGVHGWEGWGCMGRHEGWGL